MERFGVSRLFEDVKEAPSSPVYWVLGGILLVLLFSSFYVYLQAGPRFAGNRLHQRLATRYAFVVGLSSGLGLAWIAFALLAVPFLSKRIWLIIALAGLLGGGAHSAYYFRRRYPVEREVLESGPSP